MKGLTYLKNVSYMVREINKHTKRKKMVGAVKPDTIYITLDVVKNGIILNLGYLLADT